MIVTLSCKTPDLIGTAVSHLSDEQEQFDAIVACEKWVKHGEYLTVEVDTNTGLARVLPAKG